MMTHISNCLTRALALSVVVTILATGPAAAEQGTHRSTKELREDLRATQQEYKKYQGLTSKVKSAANQSSNAARESVIHNFQDFMGFCIQRREGELGKEVTLKQHGKMVQPGTTDAAEVGTPVPVKKSAKGSGLYGTTNGDRMRQLSHMKSLYISAKNNSRPAIEKQTNAFDRYVKTIEKFGHQLEWGINGLTQELDRRDAEAEDKARKDKEELEDD